MEMDPLAMQPELSENAKDIVEALSAAEQQQQAEVASESYNLAQDLDEGLAREVGQEIKLGFKDDDASRTDWLDQHAFWLSLYMQNDYSMNSDPDRSWGATESIPILTEACDQFQARTYKTFFPQDTFVSAVPMRRSKEDREVLEARAERIGKHMSYQLGFQDKNFKRDKDALFLGTAVHGSFFTKTYFSSKLLRPKIDNIRPTDLVVNYNVGPVHIEDLRRKTHIIYTTVGETEQLVQSGYFSQAAVPGVIDGGESPYNVKVDESQGLTPVQAPGIKRDAPAILYEQHFYLDLEGNGQFRPYIGTIDAASGKLLRLTIGYEADPLGNPLKDYEQIQYFTHYKFKNNPDGFYGLGLGHTIGDLNSAANIMLRQTIDAATLANDGNMSGFIGESLGVEGDEIRMTLGKFRQVPNTMGAFKDSIMMMEFPGPNQALMALMEQIDARAQRLGSNTDATTGTPQRAEQATVYLAQIEQAMEQFSSTQMRLSDSLGEELQKVYRINQRHLPLISYYVVNSEPEQITRADYTDDMLVRPVFDPKFATQQQKMARATAELQGTLQNPVNQGRPQVVDEAFRRYFEAMEVDDIDLLIPPQPQVENFDDQLTENMFFLMPPEARPLFDVFPDQNHAQHLVELNAFAVQFGQGLQPEQQEAILKHKMKHEAYLYGQQHGIIPTEQNPTPPLAARNGIAPPEGASIAQLQPGQAAGIANMLGTQQPSGMGIVPEAV